MGKYFDRFPTVDYDGQIVKNLLSKVDFTDAAKRDIYSSFDFTVTDASARADLLSEVAYKNPQYDWLIYLANGMIDPYYDYYMNDSDFALHIKQKYGSVSAAMSQILGYRNNWAPDDSTLPVSVYDELPAAMQKYYKPVVSNSNQIMGYERRQDDWIVSTNAIEQLTLSESTEGMKIGDLFVQESTGASATICAIVSDNVLNVHHLVGQMTLDARIENIQLISRVIPEAESAFWAPFNAYDKEIEQNESNKYISLIKSSYLSDVDKSFKEQIK